MAIESQNISLSMNKGVDTKTDPKQVVPGKFLELRNATFEKTNSLKKRNGYSLKGASITTGNAVAAFQSELVAMDGENVYSYNDNFNTLDNVGKKLALGVNVTSIVKNTYNQSQPDSAFSGDLSCYAWNDSSGGVYYSVFDKDTKHAILGPTLIASTASNPKVLSLGGYFFILYVDSTTPSLKFKTIKQSDLTTTTVTVATILPANTYYDAQVINARLFIAYSDTSSYTSIKYTDSTLAVSSAYQQTVASNQKCVFGDSSNNVTVAYNDGAAAKFFQSNYANTTQVIAPTLIETIADIQNITGIYNGSTARFFYEVLNDTDNVSDNFIRTNTYNGSVGTASEFIRSLGLYSKPFIYNSKIYLVCTHDSTLQSTYFILDQTAAVVGKLAQFNGGGLSIVGLLAEVKAISSGIYGFAYLLKDFVQSIGGDVFTQTGVNSAEINFGEAIQNSTMGSNLNLTGAITSMYDGQNVVEKGFNLYPEDIELESTYGGGGLSDGVYQYKSVYEWTDAQGQIHRSAPSIAKSIDTKNTYNFITGRYPGDVVPVSYFELRPASTGESFETSLSKIRVGNEVSGGSLPAGAYITDIFKESNDVYRVYISASYTQGSNVNFGVTVKSNYKFNGSSSLGSKDYTLYQDSFGSYFGTGVNGSSFISMARTDGIKPGMQLLNLTDKFSGTITVTSVVDGGINVSSAATADFTSVNIWICYPITIPGSGSVTTFSLTIPPNGLHYYVGQYVFNAGVNGVSYGTTYATRTSIYIASITKLSLTWSITLSAAVTVSATNAYTMGMSNQANFTENQSVEFSTGFTSPLDIESIGVNTLTMSEKASSTSTSVEVASSQGFSMNVDVPTLRVTDKENVGIALYRTLVNQTTFYRVNPATSPTINDKTDDRVSIFDGTPDGLLIGNEQLYTTGDVLENIAPPAALSIGNYKNRVTIIPSENRKSIWYSKQVSSGVVPEFSDSFLLQFPELGGDLVCSAQLDEKLIAFKRNNIFYLVGDGPSDNGLNNDFSQPVLLPADTGCISAKSVVMMPMGLMYQSTKGIYLLDRSLAVQYIGADVEAYNGQTVTSSRLIEGFNQVRFTMSSGVVLVYDYLYQQWSVFSGISAADACIFAGLYTYIKSNGNVYQESIGTFTDDGAFIGIYATTSWLSLAGLQGFQRARRMLILGDYKSAHTIQINVAYDFESSYTQSESIPVLSAPSGPYQYRLNFNRQKCEAIQINLSEQQSAPYGEGLCLSSMGLEIGAKKGLNKLSSAKSYG